MLVNFSKCITFKWIGDIGPHSLKLSHCWHLRYIISFHSSLKPSMRIQTQTFFKEWHQSQNIGPRTWYFFLHLTTYQAQNMNSCTNWWDDLRRVIALRHGTIVPTGVDLMFLPTYGWKHFQFIKFFWDLGPGWIWPLWGSKFECPVH